VGKPEGKRPLERRRLRWEYNIKRDLIEIFWGLWTGLIWLRIGTSGQLFLKKGNGLSGSTMCGDSIDSLRNCQILKKKSDSCS
jgi:hypothetical protein